MKGEKKCAAGRPRTLRGVLGGLLTLALLGGAGAAVNAAAAQTYTERTRDLLQNPPAGIAFPEQAEDRLFSLLNDLRKDKGLSVLQPRAPLREAARAHSIRMQHDDFFAHQDPDGRGALDRVAAFDRSGLYSSIAENLAKIRPPGSDPAKTVHQGWVDSPGHYKNMISEKPSHVGIGCALRERVLFCTQVFGTIRGRLETPLPVHADRGERYRVAAQIDGLKFAGWVLLDRQDRERAAGGGPVLNWPSQLAGEFHLRILGERREGNRIYQHRFFGPAVVLQ